MNQTVWDNFTNVGIMPDGPTAGRMAEGPEGVSASPIPGIGGTGIHYGWRNNRNRIGKGLFMGKLLLSIMVIGCLAGCYTPHSEQVRLQQGVRSDSLDNNFITRPIIGVVSFLIGEGIVVNNVKEVRTPEGFLEVQVSGVNQSAFKKRFEYRTEWLDANGLLIDSVMSKWMTVSVPARSDFAFKVVSPRADAGNYRINTRVAKYMDE